MQLRSDSLEMRMFYKENNIESFNDIQRNLFSIHEAELDEELSAFKREVVRNFQTNANMPTFGKVFDSENDVRQKWFKIQLWKRKKKKTETEQCNSTLKHHLNE